MEPLDKTFYVDITTALNEYKKYEDVLIIRLNFIFESILKAVKKNVKEYNIHIGPIQIRNYIENKNTLFDWRICHKDNWYGSNLYIIYEGQTINIFEKFPSHWIDWNFEDELEDCLNDYIEEQRKTREEYARKREEEIKVYNEAIEKHREYCINLSMVERQAISSLIK